MGYNSIIVLQNSDLDLIATDAEFGKNVHDTITYAEHAIRSTCDNTAPYRSAAFQPARLTDIRAALKEDAPAYDLQSTVSQHADVPQHFLISNGNLHPVPYKGDGLSVDVWKAIAVKARELGIESKLGSFDTRKLGDPQIPTESEFMRGWAEPEFNKATTSLIILNDGLNEIGKSSTFGRDVAAKVREMWEINKHVEQRIAQDQEFVPGYMPDSIGVGSFANPASVIGSTPAGRDELVTISGNWGRTLRAERPVQSRPDYREHMLNLYRRDVEEIGEALQRVGFSVQMPGKTRMSPPARWNADGFIKVEEADAPAP